MNGFKDGASSDDPFRDTAADGDNAEDEKKTGNKESHGIDDDSTDTATEKNDNVTETKESEESIETTEAPISRSLPWIYKRKNITDGREQTVQLHLQSLTLDEQRQGLAEVEGILGESVKKADLREAAFLVGLSHLDEVAATLQEWGYDFK